MLFFPRAHGIDEELLEWQRTRELIPKREHKVRRVTEHIQDVVDVEHVQRAPLRVVHVVEFIRDMVPALRRIFPVRRFRETDVVDAVGLAPGVFRPVGRCFLDVMVVVSLVDENEALLRTAVGQLAQSGEIPRVELRQVVLAQTVPRGARAGARPRLLVERRPDFAVDAGFTAGLYCAGLPGF